EPSFALHPAIAPFAVVVTVTNVRDETLRLGGESIAHTLEQASLDVLLDDRDERAGVKFKDADLIGIPFRVTVGKRFPEGFVELTDRLHSTTEDIATQDLASRLQTLIASDLPIAAPAPSKG
ncbi:MAG: proline--tRNA ligase, partial [Caulobacteraceae bacterium]|nr:proline--tRNA ligase [Caulobacter sp.]